MSLFSNLIESVKKKARPPIKIVIWNTYIVDTYKDGAAGDSSTYEGLREAERHAGGSMSSELLIHPDSSIPDTLEAIYNETNIQLCYKEITDE